MYHITRLTDCSGATVVVTGGNLAARCDSIISQLSLAVKVNGI